ncbi:MAG: hypothetical protein A2Y54_06115 [Chloroflexi bacterium RBG_16_51_16]|nr:MAG: hypothetical protein A2Y54_06115 [Chloroflexi bacterium RBG_16_51_16]
MNTGMLWFDNDPSVTLPVKIRKAAAYYQQKFGRSPDLCLVHPGLIGKSGVSLMLEKITVRAYRPVLPGHFWIGMQDQN